MLPAMVTAYSGQLHLVWCNMVMMPSNKYFYGLVFRKGTYVTFAQSFVCFAIKWLKNGIKTKLRDLYQGYLTEDLSTVRHTYLESGVYAGDAGDVSVLTLANILHLPITVFTTIRP